ncbi:hypothetical protein HB364_14845 [Pseudoflavitalea sp. X16]|uniref:hypothetical protein n=1 Tax=Paraflavitalea devenefica TaxID=2716334 RepID=UPI00142427D0|nr:hypothetical protein [Paraflavitalea devenefica]NII26366.1 hypothetical protein [Paraflavitalea devenefica]
MSTSKDPKKQLPPYLYVLSVKEVEQLRGVTTSTARRDLKEVRDKLNRKSRQPVFLTEYCEYFGYPLEKACKFLNIRYVQEPQESYIDWVEVPNNSVTIKRKAS